MNWILQPRFKKTRRGMMRKLNVSSGLQGEFIYRHHVVPRVKLYVPREETFFSDQVHRRYKNYRHNFRCDVGETYFEDYWNVDGEKE